MKLGDVGRPGDVSHSTTEDFHGMAEQVGSQVGPVLALRFREGGDGDENTEALVQLINYQSREMRDFIRFARGG